MTGWTEEELRDDPLTVADVEEIGALARRLKGMDAEDLAALRAEVVRIKTSPGSTPAEVSYATVMGAGCEALARGENPEMILTMLITMRANARARRGG